MFLVFTLSFHHGLPMPLKLLLHCTAGPCVSNSPIVRRSARILLGLVSAHGPRPFVTFLVVGGRWWLCSPTATVSETVARKRAQAGPTEKLIDFGSLEPVPELLEDTAQLGLRQLAC